MSTQLMQVIAAAIDSLSFGIKSTIYIIHMQKFRVDFCHIVRF